MPAMPPAKRGSEKADKVCFDGQLERHVFGETAIRSRRREVSEVDLDCRFPDRFLLQSETLYLLLKFFCAGFLTLLKRLLALSEPIGQQVLDVKNPGLFFRRENMSRYQL
jgi:hypothetical protein